MARVAVALSGGVDSLCALLALKSAGHDAIAIHGLFKPDAALPENLASVCDQAGAKLEIIDLRERFNREVIASYANSRLLGLTPNPCALCNRAIKFGALLEAALALGADYMATGHYARISQGQPSLAPAKDRGKDQSYFLSLVAAEKFRRVLFPLADFTKAEAREFVASRGFAPPLSAESQDVCFLEKGEAIADAPGPILVRLPGQEDAALEKLAEVGRHEGASRFTIGQRRGLGIPWREPLYVREIVGNRVVLAPKSLLLMKSVAIADPNYFLPPDMWPREILARFRYRQKPRPVKAVWSESGLALEIGGDCEATAAGQVAAIYDDAGLLLAGGIIDRVELR